MTKEQQKENIARLSGTDPRKCMKCGKCSGRCPAYKDMDIKPHQFVMYLEKGMTEKLLASKAIWNCLSCMACEERCPRGVSPARIMEALRLLQIRQQGNNKLPAESVEHYPSDMPQQLLVAAFRKYNK